MPLEIASYINGLDSTNPTGLDSKSQGDDHLRLVKLTLKNTFPNIAGAMNLTETVLNGLPASIATKLDSSAFVKATTPQAQAGTDDAAYMTALKTAQAIAQLTPPGVPTGTIIDFAGLSPPSGYLACPTAANALGNRTTHAALFAVVGIYWGAGNGTTTFGLPWFIEGGVSLHSRTVLGGQTSGQNLSHVHPWSNGATNIQTAGVGGANWGSSVAGEDAASMLANGGPNNLAAGSYLLKCVKL